MVERQTEDLLLQLTALGGMISAAGVFTSASAVAPRRPKRSQAVLAQMVERQTEDLSVLGSIPRNGTFAFAVRPLSKAQHMRCAQLHGPARAC